MTSIVCITGDVHHNIHKDVEVDEVEAAKEYINILKNKGVRATLFVTGKCIDENKKFWYDTSKKEYIELGAHTYYAFTFLNKVFDKVLKSPYGPYLYQYFDCWKTVNAFKKIRVKPISWRTHSYAGDENTEKILPKFGFRITSDRVTPGEFYIHAHNGLLDVPISILNDDDIMSLHRRYANRHSITAKGEEIVDSIKMMTNLDSLIVTQLHPVCMKVLDNFNTFKEIINILKSKEYVFTTIRELVRIMVLYEYKSSIMKNENMYSVL